jgi:hypothetical protein
VGAPGSYSLRKVRAAFADSGFRHRHRASESAELCLIVILP